jgi:hypothetical protein
MGIMFAIAIGIIAIVLNKIFTEQFDDISDKVYESDLPFCEKNKYLIIFFWVYILTYIIIMTILLICFCNLVK